MDPQTLDPNRFAAIVYDHGAKVDGLMSTFARELIEADVDARGIVQLPPDAAGCGPGALMKLHDVATGEVIPLCQDLGSGAGSCCLDSSALAGAAHRLRPRRAGPPTSCSFPNSASRRPPAPACAPSLLMRSVKVAPCLPRSSARSSRPGGLTGGQGTLLEGRLWVVRDWWAYVSYARREARLRLTATVCDRCGGPPPGDPQRGSAELARRRPH